MRGEIGDTRYEKEPEQEEIREKREKKTMPSTGLGIEVQILKPLAFRQLKGPYRATLVEVFHALGNVSAP